MSDFKNLIQDFQNSLERDAGMKLIPILEKHHKFFRQCISALADQECHPHVKREALSSLITLIHVHGRAEEETLYHALSLADDKEARVEGFGGHDEHNVAYQTSDELEEMGYQTTWTEEIAAKAKVFAGMIKNHIREEEATMYPIAKKDLTADRLNQLVPSYLLKCRTLLAGLDSGLNSNLNSDLNSSPKPPSKTPSRDLQPPGS